MTQKAQAILLGRLAPQAACRSIEPLNFSVALTPAEPGWDNFIFGFQLYRDQIHVVVDYAHADPIDRGAAVAKMRRTVRNLANWFLLGQSLYTSTTLSLTQEQVIVKYEGDTVWVSQLDPLMEEGELKPNPTAEAVQKGGAFLPYLLGDRLLLYALQDYASAVANPEFALFLLWRAIEWILWEYDNQPEVRNRAYAPTEKALVLPEKWLAELGRLAHTYARHARIRDVPEQHLVDAAQARVRGLIMRYLQAKHTDPSEPLSPLLPDPLTGWQPPL